MKYSSINLKAIREKFFDLKQDEAAKGYGIKFRTYQNYEINGIPLKKRPEVRGIIEDYAAARGIVVDTKYLYADSQNGIDEKPKDKLSLKEKVAIVKKINEHEEEFYRFPQFRKLIENFSKDELYDKVMKEVSDIKEMLKTLNKTDS